MEVIQTPDGNGGRTKEIIEKDYFVLESLKAFYDGRGLQTELVNIDGTEKWKLTVKMGANPRDKNSSLYGMP